MISTNLNIESAKRNAAIRDEVIRAMSWQLGIGFHTELGSVLGQVADYYPTDLAGWYFFIDPDKYTSLTPGTTLKAGGTTPAVVTLSGTKTSRGAVRIEIQSATTFRWSYDNDGTPMTVPVATGVTIPAGGAAYVLTGSGLSATFPAGTYTTGNTYEETVSAIVDQVNGSNSFTQATDSKQPRLLKKINGKYCLRFDGVDDTMGCAAIDLLAPTGSVPLWCYGIAVMPGTNINGFNRFWGCASSFWMTIRGATTIDMTNGADANTITYTAGTAARFITKYTGGGLADSFKWGSATAVTSGNAGGSNPPSGFWIGSSADAASTYADYYQGAGGISSVEATGSNLTNLEAWTVTNYGSVT